MDEYLNEFFCYPVEDKSPDALTDEDQWASKMIPENDTYVAGKCYDIPLTFAKKMGFT